MRIWKEIPNTNGIYFVSNDGLVKSVDHHVKHKDGNKRLQFGRILKPIIVTKGYLHVILCLGGKRLQISVHRLVALAFIPNPENKPQVNHIDCNKKNNLVNNLEWVTNRENIIHAHKNNLIKLNYGENNHQSKLKNSEVITIRERIKNGESASKIAKEFNVDYHTIKKIEKKETYKNV